MPHVHVAGHDGVRAGGIGFDVVEFDAGVEWRGSTGFLGRKEAHVFLAVKSDDLTGFVDDEDAKVRVLELVKHL